MPHFTLVVLSDPTPGREEEYNDWYTNQHLGDVLKIPGVVSATRLQMMGAPLSEQSRGYCALYEVDCDDPQRLLDMLQGRAGTDEMPLTDAIDFTGAISALYAPIATRPL